MSGSFDVAILGGGIVGLATALALLESCPDGRVVVLEKEALVGAHQTGHNSGVIHSGLYYKPGSEKARLCVEGSRLMHEFCVANDIPHEICGKVVIASSKDEVPALEELLRRGRANGVLDVALVGPERLLEIEPHAAGARALHLPGVGIVDYRKVAAKMAALVSAKGGEVRTGARVEGIRNEPSGVRIETAGGEVLARFLIACAGLQSDRVAEMDGGETRMMIIPFRGEYYELVPERCDLVRGLIYPVPDPRFPFLGVHFTRKLHGHVEAGPNAVLALAREGYRKTDLDVRDTWDVLSYPGFWRMAAKYWRTGSYEVIRSLSKRAFVRALSRLVPDLKLADVRPAGSGIRAQALFPSGALADDFVIEERPRSLHVLNAPSPAATASLAIGAEIARRARALFDLRPRSS